ncbi:MAG TPA: NAD-dependent epimerase/dehydratase family protein [Gaiellaceae bacterium]
MPRRAFLLGGSGQTGRALVPRLLEHGWEVTIGSRGGRPIPAGTAQVELDRNDGSALRSALAGGVDVLIDFIAFEPEHAEQLLSLRGLVRSLVVISSASVYADAQGRTMDEAGGPDSFPEFRVPITEAQRIAEPGPATYSTRKAAIEQLLLGQDELPATVVRPGAIHGPGGQWNREWYVVKRVLDRRRFIALADQGRSRFHTTSVDNLAELLWLAAERPGFRALNCGDPSPPSVLEIVRAIAGAMEHDWAELLLPRSQGLEGPGETPWSVPKPVVLDLSEAELQLGYRPLKSYERAVPRTIEWLVEATRRRPWEEVLPGTARNLPQAFDYEAEDALVAGLTAG